MSFSYTGWMRNEGNDAAYDTNTHIERVLGWMMIKSDSPCEDSQVQDSTSAEIPHRRWCPTYIEVDCGRRRGWSDGLDTLPHYQRTASWLVSCSLYRQAPLCPRLSTHPWLPWNTNPENSSSLSQYLGKATTTPHPPQPLISRVMVLGLRDNTVNINYTIRRSCVKTQAI